MGEALEQWREWTKGPFDWDKDYRPDWQSAQQETEELAHNAINELLAELAAMTSQRNNLVADWNKEHPRRLDAEAELAALKAMVEAISTRATREEE
jgi:uncharacterized protein involved in exopolysaccharide biosynthesis